MDPGANGGSHHWGEGASSRPEALALLTSSPVTLRRPFHSRAAKFAMETAAASRTAWAFVGGEGRPSATGNSARPTRPKMSGRK